MKIKFSLKAFIQIQRKYISQLIKCDHCCGFKNRLEKYNCLIVQVYEKIRMLIKTKISHNAISNNVNTDNKRKININSHSIAG